MGKTLAYLRASTDKQDNNNQKLEVIEFDRKKDLKIDDFIELTMSSQKPSKQRRIDELINRLNPSDTLIVTELSRLGRSTAEVISLINTLVENNVRVIILKQQLDIQQHDMNSKIIITMFSLFG
ncbi:MAG: recombinase family protein, partial [Methylococcales bacterium]